MLGHAPRPSTPGLTARTLAYTQATQHERRLTRATLLSMGHRLPRPKCVPWCCGTPDAQVWFDSPEALRLRYELAARLGLRGVGFWNLESLHIPEDASAAAGAERQAMWQAVESGFFGGGGGQGGPAGAAAEL